MSAASDVTADVIAAALTERGIEFDRVRDDAFVVNLPGERRLKTACWLTIGEHALTIDAFVVRKPDENHAAFYRYLLQHNARSYVVSWSIDTTGDVYLTGRLPLTAVNADELDRVLGAVLEYADGAFNELLKLGFGTSIRREWAWRTKNDLPRQNLAAFEEFATRGTT
ncbi:YbjN domain-containing protein [Jatrophihabitans sp. YIM 134969]